MVFFNLNNLWINAYIYKNDFVYVFKKSYLRLDKTFMQIYLV
jgi:hypothetical protein